MGVHGVFILLLSVHKGAEKVQIRTEMGGVSPLFSSQTRPEHFQPIALHFAPLDSEIAISDQKISRCVAKPGFEI
jgi:hypothetical protein